MALTYSYDDDFIINSITTTEIETAETNALFELEKMGVVDAYYLEKMCACLVYISLATKQLEAEGMKDRISQYNADYKRYTQMNNFAAVDTGVFCGTIGRS